MRISDGVQTCALPILEVATAICAAVDIPVSADLENGFHDEPLECGRLMEAAIRAGLAGASIEDASGRKDQPIYPFEHAVERVRQSVAAARSAGDLVVTARAENFLHGRLDLRSEEHTSELQSLMRISYAVFCLKKQTQQTQVVH